MGLTSDGIGLLFTARGDTSDAKKAFKDLKDSASGDIAAVEKSGTGATSALGSGFSSLVGPVSAAAAGIAAVATVGVTAAVSLFAMAKSAADAGSAIKDVSDKTGLSAASLSTLKLAADQSGASLEQISTSVTKFSRLIGQAADGSETAKDSLIRLGLDPQKAINDLDGSLDKVFRSIFEAKNPIVATTLATAAFGKSGADLIPVVKQMNGDFAAFKEEATRLGVVLSEDDVNAADAFGDSLTALEAQVKGVTTQFSLGFLPAITQALQEVSGELSDNKNVWREWGEFVGGVILQLTRGVKLISALVLDVGQALSGNSQFGENLGRAVKEANESRDNEQFRKQIQDNINDPNRSEFLKQQDKDIARLGKAGRGGNSDSNSSSAAKKAGKSTAQSFSEGFREFAKDNDFVVSSVLRKGKQINAGSKHALGLAGDLKLGGKSSEEIVNVLAAGIQKGYRVLDERLGAGSIPGVVSKGRNVHFESAGSKKESLFIDRRPDLYGGQAGLDYLKKLDADRRNKKTSTDEIADLAKKQVENEKKASEDSVKNRQTADRRVLEIARNTAAEEYAINEKLLAQKLISQDEFDQRSEQSAIDLLAKERILLEERLALAKSLGVDTIEIEQEIADKVSEIKVKQTEAETAAYLKSKKYLADLKQLRLEVLEAQREAFEQDKEQQRQRLENDVDKSFGSDRLTALIVLRDFEIAENLRRKTEAIEDADRERDAALETITDKVKEKGKVEEINRLYQARLDLINQIHAADDENTNRDLNPQINTEAGGGGLLGILAGGLGSAAGGGVDPGKQITDQAEYIKAVYNDLKETAKGAIGSMVQGLGQLVTSFITTGKFSAKAALQMASGIITGLAIQSGIKALYEIAEGYAMLANPFTAALAPGHFAAAAAYATVAAAAGAIGIGVGLASRAFGGGGGGGGTGGFRNQSNTGFGGQGNNQTGSRSFTGGAFSGSGDTVTTFENGINSPQIVRHEIDLTDSSGKRSKFIVNTIENSANSNGTIRNLIRDVVNDL